MSRNDEPTRDQYSYWMTIPTRWSDNDMLGHLNNVTYFRFFEAIVVRFVIDEAGLQWAVRPMVPFAAEVLCRFRRPLSFPVDVEAGLSVAALGTSSVTYAIGLFGANQTAPAAYGRFVHVFVERSSEAPTPIPEDILQTFLKYRAPADAVY